MAIRDILLDGFRVGDFTVHARADEIIGADGTHHLQPKVMDVLVCLAEKQGSVVSHSEILESVWGDREHSRDALAHCVSEIRTCFGDHAENSTYIRTIPKRGYQLIAPVTTLSEASSVPVAVRSSATANTLWENLKRRNVVRVSIAYTAVSWLLLQFAEIAFDALVFPTWSLRVLFIVLAIGFLVAVVIAWAYQVVPEEDPEFMNSRTRKDRWLQQAVDIGIIAILAVTVGLLAYRQLIVKPVFDDFENELPVVELREPDEHSVAVLRFESLDTDTRFSDGLAENLLHMLARLKEVSVPSRSTTWDLSDSESDVIEIANQLRVRYVLEGSVQQIDDDIRVFAQLIDGRTGNHVWSKIYTRPLTAAGFFETQDEIAAQVVKQIEVTLSDKSRAQIQRIPTENMVALQHYLTGRDYQRKPMAPETLGPAVSAFEQAILLDPEYTEAYAGLCDAHLGWYRLNNDANRYSTAEDACLKAVMMNESLPEVHVSMGTLYRYAGRYAEAELQLKKALEITPGASSVLEELGRTYRAANRLVEADQTFQAAIVAEPSSWSAYKSMGNFLFRTGRYEEALPYYRQVLILQPSDSAGYNNYAVTMFMLGRFDDANIAWTRVISDAPTRLTYVNYANSLYYSTDYELSVDMYKNALAMNDRDYRVWRSMATSMRRIDPYSEEAASAYNRSIELAREMLDINPADAEVLSQIAVAYARLGQNELSGESLRHLNEVGWENPNVSYFVALAHLLLGENTTAIRELERAVLMGFPRPLISEDPDFHSLSNNKRYMALVSTGPTRPGG